MLIFHVTKVCNQQFYARSTTSRSSRTQVLTIFWLYHASTQLLSPRSPCGPRWLPLKDCQGLRQEESQKCDKCLSQKKCFSPHRFSNLYASSSSIPHLRLHLTGYALVTCIPSFKRDEKSNCLVTALLPRIEFGLYCKTRNGEQILGGNLQPLICLR